MCWLSSCLWTTTALKGALPTNEEKTKKESKKKIRNKSEHSSTTLTEVHAANVVLAKALLARWTLAIARSQAAFHALVTK